MTRKVLRPAGFTILQFLLTLCGTVMAVFLIIPLLLDSEKELKKGVANRT
jgi:hypothetical protein